MIPVIVGAAAVGLAGAALLGGNDKPKQPVKEKRQVSEDYVMKQLARAGKNIPTNATPSTSGMEFACSGDFGADFEKIENMLASPNVNDEFISEALNAIEQQAERQWSDRALNLVADYREKLRQRHGSASGMKFIPSGDFSADFEKVENMLASPNVNDEFISEALNAIEQQAERQWSDRALNLVADYREKLRQRHGSASGTRFIPSGDFFGTDFKRIENMITSPNVSNESIGEALSAIESLAIQKGETNPLNFVEYYRKQLGKRRR